MASIISTDHSPATTTMCRSPSQSIEQLPKKTMQVQDRTDASAATLLEKPKAIQTPKSSNSNSSMTASVASSPKISKRRRKKPTPKLSNDQAVKPKSKEPQSVHPDENHSRRSRGRVSRTSTKSGRSTTSTSNTLVSKARRRMSSERKRTSSKSPSRRAKQSSEQVPVSPRPSSSRVKSPELSPRRRKTSRPRTQGAKGPRFPSNAPRRTPVAPNPEARSPASSGNYLPQNMQANPQTPHLSSLDSPPSPSLPPLASLPPLPPSEPTAKALPGQEAVTERAEKARRVTVKAGRQLAKAAKKIFDLPGTRKKKDSKATGPATLDVSISDLASVAASENSLDLAALVNTDHAEPNVFKFDASDPSVAQFDPFNLDAMHQSIGSLDRIHLRQSMRGKRSATVAQRHDALKVSSLHNSLSRVDALKAVEAIAANSPRQRRTTKGQKKRRDAKPLSASMLQKENDVSMRELSIASRGGERRQFAEAHQSKPPATPMRRPGRSTPTSNPRRSGAHSKAAVGPTKPRPQRTSTAPAAA